MLSIVVLARNCRQLLMVCLQSLLDTATALGLGDRGVEYIFLDDFSDEDSPVVELFKDFRSAVSAPVTIVRFREHVHYAHGVAHGLSLTRKRHALFLSHDMAVTPDCVRKLLLLAGLHPTFGVIRPISAHMDGAPDAAVCCPPWPLRDVRDVTEFSTYVADYHGTHVTAAEHLIGDAMLVTRNAIDRVGTFDTRFRGFLADVDYGLRVQRAGLEVVLAHGAWLHHEGSGFTKDGVQRKRFTAAEIGHQNLRDVALAYERFRDKWDTTLPAQYPGLDQVPFERLRALPRSMHADPQPPPAAPPSLCELH